MAKSAPLVLGLALPFAYALCLAADLPGQVVRVLNGDTIEVLHSSHPERIRLSGIECPKMASPNYQARGGKNGAGVFVDPEREDCLGHLLDV